MASDAAEHVMGEQGPMFCFLCTVSACPCIGAMCMDCHHTEKKELDPLPPLNIKEPKETALAIKKRLDDCKAHPPTCQSFSAPVQFTMTNKENAVVPIAITKNPDLCMTCLTWCGPRCGASMWLAVLFIPGVMSSKFVTFGFLCLGMGAALSYTLFILILSLCCPKLKFKSPGIRTVIGDVIKFKVKDKHDEKETQKAGGSKIILMIKRTFSYLWAIITSVFCCQFLRPKYAYTFGKTILSMIFTEIFMAVSIWFYFAFHFMLTTFTCSLCSMFSWVEELLVAQAIRERLTFWQYPAFDGMRKKDNEDKPEVPMPEAPTCCGQCLGCCSCCSGCDIVCHLCEPFCCTLCDLTLDFVGDSLSALLVFGKAWVYTLRQFEEETGVGSAV